MVDKKGRADNTVRVLAALSRLVLESRAARYVLENAVPRPSNWATQLHDFRSSPANQKLALESVDGLRAALQEMPDAILQTLAEGIEQIAPLYPSTSKLGGTQD
jgi:hypothetical protein